MALAMAHALGYNSRVEAGTIGYVCGGISLIAAIFASIWICALANSLVQTTNKSPNVGISLGVCPTIEFIGLLGTLEKLIPRIWTL